jgi:murein DD-endopeptidase MepM/ murein hydrolase activator NlpD
MSREERKLRKHNKQISLKNKYIIYWLAILGIAVIALMLLAVNTNNTSSSQIEQDDIADFVISDIDEETESTSSSIANAVDEVKQENETEESNNKAEEQNNDVKDEKLGSVENTKEDTSNQEKEETEANLAEETINEVEENEEKIEVVKKEITFIKPVSGEIIKEFSKDNLIYSQTLKEWITHNGIDISAEKTTIVKAVADGIVKSIKNDPRYGLTVIMTHDDGYETVYSNLLTAEFVVEGETLTAGQSIGTVGNTSSFESSDEYHLHFEMKKDGEYIDPSIYIK